MSYRFQCAQCQRRFFPTDVNFVPPINHQHFDCIECRDEWIREWKAIYGRVAVGGKEYLPADPEQLSLDFANDN